MQKIDATVYHYFLLLFNETEIFLKIKHAFSSLVNVYLIY